jgi:hypothetical protein
MPGADASLPETAAGRERDAPACLGDDEAYAAAVAEAVPAVTGERLDASLSEDGLLGDVGGFRE